MRVAAVLVLVAGCSNDFLQRPGKDVVTVDDKLAITGRVCTDRPDPSSFPVKVIFLIDQSGSMCVSDPPGSQLSSGFCQSVSSTLAVNGQTTPGRVRALSRLIDTFAGRPNVEVALVPFETSIRPGTEYPATGFARPTDPQIKARISDLQHQLGKGTDYQGALAYAYGRIRDDIEKTNRTNPTQLARTRYVVVFLTDGVPYPKCAANDQLSVYADDLNPDQTWADSFGLDGPDGFCNLTDPQGRQQFNGPSNNIPTYEPGTDRNQNYQLRAYVDQLMELKRQYTVGDVRLHTVLLFNEEAVRVCGDQCQDIYGEYVRYPSRTRVDGPPAAHEIARWTLRMLSDHGNGTFQEFRDFAGIAHLDLGALDYTSLRSKNVMKALFVQPLSSLPGPVNRVEDSDGDGLSDSVDQGFMWKTSPFDGDSDGDGFPDSYEVGNRDKGFVANVRDTRGCEPLNPATRNCTPSDVDGDGVTDFHERYLSPVLAETSMIDADGDGIPNGIEVLHGLNPLVAQRSLDTDGDGVSDVDEVFLASDPLGRDGEYRERNGVILDVDSTEQADESICYDFSLSNVQLVTPPLRAGQSRQGFNLFKVWFAEVPELAASTDYGTWKAACVWAQYDPPVRVPAGPAGAPLADSNFYAPAQLIREADYDVRCLGTNPSRGQVSP